MVNRLPRYRDERPVEFNVNLTFETNINCMDGGVKAYYLMLGFTKRICFEFPDSYYIH